MCLLCMYMSYISCIFLYITCNIKASIMCLLFSDAIYFFLQKFNSNKWCYLFQLKMFASCCVFFFVLLCSVIVFHFYRVFFSVLIQTCKLILHSFLGKYYIDITQISVLDFFFLSVHEKRNFFYMHLETV